MSAVWTAGGEHDVTTTDSEPTGRPMPREGEPTPRQVREAMRALHEQGYDFTYKQAWTLVRAALRRDKLDAMRAKAREFLLQIVGPSFFEAALQARDEIDHAMYHYRG